MRPRSPPRACRKLRGGCVVEVRQEREVLREVRLDRLDAVRREVLDPRLREVVLDPVEDAASFHVRMIERAPDVDMSRSAHLFAKEGPTLRPFLLVNPRSGDGGTDDLL